MKCENCGKDIPYILVHGYGFGDRMLEGVHFKVEDFNGKPHVIGTDADDYMEDLNKEKWYKICEDYCEGLDLGTCPECGEDKEVPVEWIDEKKVFTAAKPIKIMSFNEVMGDENLPPFMRNSAQAVIEPGSVENQMNKLSKILSNPEKIGLEKFDPDAPVEKPHKVDLSKYVRKIRTSKTDFEIDDVLQRVYAKALRDSDEINSHLDV